LPIILHISVANFCSEKTTLHEYPLGFGTQLLCMSTPWVLVLTLLLILSVEVSNFHLKFRSKFMLAILFMNFAQEFLFKKHILHFSPFIF
jgi:hypothetical protein